ncbi:LuxR C-terminal-related transcriptional regulator [Sphaerisporangium sp. B11E5]|uniref:helix-turn-helix transcriptional regulator n=1 Tax=Sphaerisporangium sp. B11E5 TaxID=3153563 RepID=UPI00325C7567
MGGGWPFVGRERETGAVLAALRGRDEAGVALAGQAGTGKTELMRHVLNRLARSGRDVKVLRTVAYAAGTPIPFGAMYRVLPRPPAETPPMWNPVQHAADTLRAAAGGRTLVIGVDDAHLLDDLSVLLLADLARSRTARVVVSVRDGEPAPRTLTALWKERVLRRVDVAPLPDADVEAALTAALGGQIEHATLARLREAARGNPLLLRELVESGQSTGALTERDGVWWWHGRWTASPRLRELIHARVGTLDGDRRRAVELLSFADSLGLALLTGLTSPEAVEELERSALVRVDRDGERLHARLAHPLHGDVIRSALPVTRARACQAELAEAIARHGARRREDPLRVALWRLDSGTPAPPESLVAAARQAWAGHDLPLTKRLVTAAVTAGSTEAVPLLGDLLLFSGRPEQAEEFYAAPPPCADRLGLVRLRFLRGVNMVWGLGRVPEGVTRMEEAAPAVLDSPWRDDLGPTYVAWLTYVGRCEAALRLAGELAALPPLSAPGETVLLAARGTINAFTGRTAEARDTGREALARMEAHAAVYPWLRGIPAFGAIYALQFAGELREAETAARDWHGTMVGNPTAWSYATALSAVALGRSARLRGRLRSAVRHLKDARRLFRESDAQPLGHIGMAELAHALVLLGDLTAARRLLAEARSLDGGAFAVFAFTLDAADAAVAAAEGDIATAAAIGEAAAGRARSMGAHSWEPPLLHDLVRAGEPGRALPRLTELAATLEGPLPPLYARHAAALAARDGRALDAVAADFAALGAALLAAEAAAQAGGVHRDRGASGAASRSAWHAARWASACEGARTPALDLTRAPVLTRREYQIALRAAQGETNVQIAAALGIAARTVGNHLYNSYDKLGVSGRAELAGMFPEARRDLR